MLRIHKEGNGPIMIGFLMVVIIQILLYFIFYNLSITAFYLLSFGNLFLISWIISFFRNPKRPVDSKEGFILSPADGKVVVLEEVHNAEYFGDRRIQVSIFMSPFNVHVNKYPISGKVLDKKYYPGKFLVAYNPKSSEANERTSTVIQNKKTVILVRQIAGIVARRIVNYAENGMEIQQGQDLGFIKFGSRVDLLLPMDTEVQVKTGQWIKANKTIIAAL